VSLVLEAPCVFCGYNGQGYWQSGTHAAECPWARVGGEVERIAIFIHTARLEREHDREVIEALKAKLAEAERALRQQQKGKSK
jgi:hypothetical protein